MTPPLRDELAPPAAGANGVHSSPGPAAPDEVVEVGTPEYDRLNGRRWELIQKLNRGGLTDAEDAEYARLDRVVGAAVDRHCPRPQILTDEQRAYILRLLGRSGGPPGP